MISAYFSNLSLYRISHLHSLIYHNRNELKRHSKVAELCKLTNDMSVPIMYHPTIVQHTDCPFVPSLCTHTHLPTHIYKWGLLPLLVPMVEFTVALHLSNTAQIASYTKGEWNPPPPSPYTRSTRIHTVSNAALQGLSSVLSSHLHLHPSVALTLLTPFTHNGVYRNSRELKGFHSSCWGVNKTRGL